MENSGQYTYRLRLPIPGDRNLYRRDVQIQPV